jgi:hypothetical protein
VNTRGDRRAGLGGAVGAACIRLFQQRNVAAAGGRSKRIVAIFFAGLTRRGVDARRLGLGRRDEPWGFGARILIMRTTRLLGLARASAVSLRVQQRARAEGCEREARARGPPRSPDSDSCTSISRDHLVPGGDDDRATTAGRSWRSLVMSSRRD